MSNKKLIEDIKVKLNALKSLKEEAEAEKKIKLGAEYNQDADDKNQVFSAPDIDTSEETDKLSQINDKLDALSATLATLTKDTEEEPEGNGADKSDDDESKDKESGDKESDDKKSDDKDDSENKENSSDDSTDGDDKKKKDEQNEEVEFGDMFIGSNLSESAQVELRKLFNQRLNERVKAIEQTLKENNKKIERKLHQKALALKEHAKKIDGYASYVKKLNEKREMIKASTVEKAKAVGKATLMSESEIARISKNVIIVEKLKAMKQAALKESTQKRNRPAIRTKVEIVESIRGKIKAQYRDKKLNESKRKIIADELEAKIKARKEKFLKESEKTNQDIDLRKAVIISESDLCTRNPMAIPSTDKHMSGIVDFLSREF